METQWFLKNLCMDTLFEISKSEFRVGRSSGIEIVCRSQSVSRQHAVFYVKPNGLFVQDLNSSNGTFVNYEKIPSKQFVQINNADVVGVGCTHCTRDKECVYSRHWLFEIIQRQIHSTMDIIDVLESNDDKRESGDKIGHGLNKSSDAHYDVVATTSREQKIPMKEKPLKIRETIDVIELLKSDVESGRKVDDIVSSSRPHMATSLSDAHNPHIILPTSTNQEPETLVENISVPTHIKEEPMDTSDVISLKSSDENAKRCLEVDGKGNHSRSHKINSLNDGHNSGVMTITSVNQPDEVVESMYIPHIKEEPMEIEVPDGVKGYSVDDDVIIIEDDDEFEFSASQLFSTNDRSIISDEKYMQIKTELAELDAMWPAEPITIESDSEWISDDKADDENVPEVKGNDINNFSSTDYNPKKRNENENKTHDNSGLNKNSVAYTESKTVDLVPHDKVCSVILKKEINGKSAKEIKTLPSTSQILTNGFKVTAKTKNLPATSARTDLTRSKYVKPPIVTPHVQEPKRTNVPVKSVGFKPPEKKPNRAVDRNVSKKSKPPKSHTKSLQTVVSKRKRNSVTENIHKSDKEEIKEKRRKKLKEIERKSTDVQKTVVNSTNDNKLKTKCYVKMSDNRGNFLLDMVPNGCTNVNTSNVTNGNIKNRENLKTKMDKNPIIKPSSNSNKIDGNFSIRTNFSKRSANGVVSEPSCSKIDVVAKQPEMIPGMSGVRSNLKVNNNTVIKRNGEPFNLDAIICVLNWKTKWAIEQLQISAPPPVTKRAPVKMCNSFSTYKDYINIVTPLLMLELWESAYRQITVAEMEVMKGDQQFIFCIEEIYPYNKGLVLKCLSYLTKEQRDHMKHPKESDLVIVNIPQSTPSQQSIKRLFGYVLSSDKKQLRPNDFIDKQLVKMQTNIPQCSLRFQVLIRYTPHQIRLDQYLAGVIIISMTPMARLFDSVVALGKSPLCKFILDPKLEDYEVPPISNNVLQSKDNLCKTQQKIILEGASVCLRNEPGIYLIHGPPGTGKTTVIVNMVRQILHDSGEKPCRVLLVASSNAAVDGIAMKIINELKPQLDGAEKKKIKFLRIGPNDSIHPNVKSYTVNELAKADVAKSVLTRYPELKKDYNRLVEDLKNAKEQLKCLKGARTDLSAKLRKAQFNYDNFAKTYLRQSYFDELQKSRNILTQGANVICTTLSSSVKLLESNLYGKITCCIVDEATQSCEPETLIPLMLGVNKIVLVGDPHQLSSVVFSKYAKDMGLGESLFTRIKSHFDSNANNPIRLLNWQYRMHPEISQFPNNNFYKGQIRNASFCLQRPQLKLVPYFIFNLNLNLKHQVNITSYANNNEVDCVSKLLVAIQNSIGDGPAYNVGIITPYNCQKYALSEKIASLKLHSDITINTVDSFQGLEKDIIILSCVRYTPNTFLADEKRLNVAITRAKSALYIVGTYTLFKNCTLLSRLKDDADRRNLYVNINTELSTSYFQSLISRH